MPVFRSTYFIRQETRGLTSVQEQEQQQRALHLPCSASEDLSIGNRRSLSENIIDRLVFLIEFLAQFIQLCFDGLFIVAATRLVLLRRLRGQLLSGHECIGTGRIHVHATDTFLLKFTLLLLQFFLSDLNLLTMERS